MGAKSLSGGYRVTSGSPLQLKKPLRGDAYGDDLNENLEIIDTQLTLSTELLENQQASLDGFESVVALCVENLLPNGGFEIWTRGYSITGADVFTADLWKVGSDFLGTVSRGRHLSTELADSGVAGPYSAVVTSAVSSAINLYTRLSFLSVLAGSALTFSASLVTQQADRFRIALRGSDGEYHYSDYASGTGAEERLLVTMTIPSGATYVEAALLGAISSGDHAVSISDATLSLGAPASLASLGISPVLDVYRCLRSRMAFEMPLSFGGADTASSYLRMRTTILPHKIGTLTSLGAESVELAGSEISSTSDIVAGTYRIQVSKSKGSMPGADEHLIVEGLEIEADPF